MSDFGLEQIIGYSPTGAGETDGSNAKQVSNKWGCKFRYVDGKIVRVYNFGTLEKTTEPTIHQAEPNRGRTLSGKPWITPLRRPKPKTA